MVKTSVGYTAGQTLNPTYEEVCSGRTGHTEAVQVGGWAAPAAAACLWRCWHVPAAMFHCNVLCPVSAWLLAAK